MSDRDRSPTQTIDYVRLYKEAEGYIRTLSIELEEGRLASESLTEQNTRLKEMIGKLEDKMKRAEERLRAQAVDELTGLPPRAVFDAVFSQVVRDNHATGESASQEIPRPAAMMVLDVDQFSQVNNRYGRVFGDHILRFIGRVISTRIRNCDVASRYQGQRFVILLPNCPAIAVLKKAREILLRISQENFGAPGEQEEQVTVTMGLSMFRPGLDSAELIRRAECAMHYGKDRGGRFCVVMYKDGGEEHDILEQYVKKGKK